MNLAVFALMDTHLEKKTSNRVEHWNMAGTEAMDYALALQAEVP